MQLGRPGPDPRTATDLASALRLATAARGHRPAVTVLGVGPERRRDEQAFASLAQWVAKGAHLLEVDHDLGPGDAVFLDAPAGWLPAAVCLAAWWIGAAVTDDPSDASVRLLHESRLEAAAPGTEVLILGDAVDGTPLRSLGHPSWAVEVQSFPDQPPAPRAAASHVALRTDGVERSQGEVLAEVRAAPAGRLGLREPDGLLGLALWLAARPAATGDPVVLVPGTEAAAAEQIAAWLDD